MEDFSQAFLSLSNETLTAATVIITASLLLYNLSRNLYDRVARSSSVVLACVTITYTCDVFLALEPSRQAFEATLRLQWIGISLMPAAMFHLSDALLATTGLPSRGRRRRVIRILYMIGAVFIVAAAFTDVLVYPVVPQPRTIFLRPDFLFLLYILFFALATGIAIINVQRAKQRCLTRDTRRRMGYLQFAMLTPAFGIFPYSLLLPPGENFSVLVLLLVNASNIIVIMMLLFLAYPLAFFGSRIPDRVVKTELLRFVLRGPATGLLALVIIIFTPPTTRVLGLPGDNFVPFAVVAVVLLWQWVIALSLPWLEKKLIYSDENDDQLNKLQNLTEQLLTRNDLLQLTEAILAAVCDYLQVSSAFVISTTENGMDMVAAIGTNHPDQEQIEEDDPALHTIIEQSHWETRKQMETWGPYWLVALYSKRRLAPDNTPKFIGLLGIPARSDTIDLTPEEIDTFWAFIQRIAQTLDDLDLQTEIYAALEGLLPQITMTRSRAAEVEYRVGYNQGLNTLSPLSLDEEQFIELVRAALKHYWGGPGLASSRLLELQVVQNALPENEDNPARALRAVLTRVIEQQRPSGERKMLSPEWTIYNILHLRFIEKHKVRDVARRLALSEPDLYRKQRVAIEIVAASLIEMEAACAEA